MHVDVSLDASPDEMSTIGDRPQGGRRPWRRAVEPLLLVAAVATAIALTNVAQPRDPPAPRRPAPPAGVSPTAAPARSIDTPRFVVPLIASPGEQIAVVAFRDRGMCGPTTLHLDGAVIPHHVRAIAPPSVAGFVELYLTVAIPTTASPGSHRLELQGPVAGPRAGVFCGDASEHQGSLAEAEILLIP